LIPPEPASPNEPIDITWLNEAVGGSSTAIGARSGIQTDSNGNFSYTPPRTSCSGTEKWQATFAGDSVYGGAVSNIAAITVASGPACTLTADYAGPAVVLKNPSNGTFCNQVCSDPSMALTPTGYHCIKAELRLGTMINPPSGSKNITVKVNQKIYFDASSGSVDYNWPGLKTDVPNYDPSFENGIAAYLYKYDGYGAPNTWKNDPADPSNIFGYWGGANFGQYVGTSCSILGGFGTWLASIYHVTAGTFSSLSYSNPGDYKIVLNVYSKNNCLGPAVDIGSVHVE